MAVFTVLGILSVFIRLIICQSSVTNDCGTLGIEQPAVHGRDVMITFTPADPTRASGILWQQSYLIGTYIDIKIDTTKYETQNTGNKFSITIKKLIDEDERYYRIWTKDENNEWDCQSERLEIQLQELGSCGVMYLKPPATVVEGSSVLLGYIPAKSQDYQWRFKHVGSRSYSPVTTYGTTMEEHTLPLNDERVLAIRNIQPSHAGTYDVLCGSTETDTSNTKSVTIDVVVLPKDVHIISPNETFLKCNECMYQQYSKTFYVECSFTEGTEKATVQITVASKILAMHKISKGVYCGRTTALDSYHMQEVKCHVTTPSLKQPLTVTSTLYVLREPGNPVLTMSTMKQGQPVSITCVCNRSRPPPRMFFLVGEETMNANQTDVEYYSSPSNKYYSTAILETVEKRWNTKELKCCIEHETLTQSKCSDSGTIHYEFPPTAVKANHSVFPQEPKSSYTIEVVCTVLDGNPACGASLGDIKEDNLRHMSTDYQTSGHGGKTTITSFIFNVTPEDQGKLLTCAANCSEFKYNLNDSFTLTLPVAHKTIRTGDKEDESPSLVLIVIVAAVSVFVVVVVVLVVVKRHKSRRDKPPERRVSFNVDTAAVDVPAAAHVSNDAGPVGNHADQTEYSVVIPRDQRPKQQALNQAGVINDTTYAVVIPKTERNKKGPKTRQEQAVAEPYVNDEQNQPAELHYADLDLQEGPSTERKSQAESQISEVEYSAVDFELSVNHKPDIYDFSGGQSNEENETIYMNE